MKNILTGIQPSGKIHIGNYFGALKPFLDNIENKNSFFMLANYHSLTSSLNKEILLENTLNMAEDILSLGLNPQKTIFFLQSDVKEVLELYFILSNFCNTGLLERSHCFKDKTSKGLNSSLSLFSYPVLMAADILLYDIDYVPVGKDQLQHLEIAREIANKFNKQFGNILTIPQEITYSTPLIKGTDGLKMSKSYKNTLNIFDDESILKNQIAKIKTDSAERYASKDYLTCNIYSLLTLFKNEEDLKQIQQDYKNGKEYKYFKDILFDSMMDYFKEAREKKLFYKENRKIVLSVLEDGAERARGLAIKKMDLIRNLVGLNLF